MLKNIKRSTLINSILALIPIAIIILPATNGCISRTVHTSIMEVDCRKATIEYAVKDTPNIITKTSFCNDYMFKNESLSFAIKIFVKEYADTFDVSEDKVWSMISGITIEVSAIPRSVHAAYDVNGKFLKGDVPVNGLALSKDYIWVEAKTSQIWSSALIHELIHIIIWRKNKVHGDPDHEGSQFSGWSKKHTVFIEKMKDILLDMEL